MNLKRRRLAVSLSLFALASLASVSSLLLTNAKGKTDEISGVEIEEKEIEGIALTNKRVVKNANGSSSTIVNYTITPEDKTNFTLISFMDWSNEKVDTFESPDWGKGVDPANYVSTTINPSKKEITFTCNEAFGRTIICSIMTKESPTIKATITLDYMRKELDKGSAAFTICALQDGVALSVTPTLPTYSVGTRTPEAPTYSIQNVKYDGGTNNTMIEAYVPCPDLSFADDKTSLEYFNGTEYETLEPLQAFKKMVRRAEKYLISVVASNGEIAFSKEALLETMTFRKKPNINADYVYNNHCGQYFINYYKEAYKNYNAGISAEIKYNKTVVKKYVLDLDLEAADTIDNVTLTKENIEF